MSEYSDKYTISRMIGSTPGYIGYEEGGQLTEAVRRKPYAVIVFDEIEKAHPVSTATKGRNRSECKQDVANILLQILDEGVLTDGQGRSVNFKNTIVILTSNLGSEWVSPSKQDRKGPADICRALYEEGATAPDGTLTETTRSEVLRAVGRFFRPELINRLDELLIFNKLPKSIVPSIVQLRLAEIQTRLNPHRITLEITEWALEWLAEKGYSEQYGARAVQRVVKDRVTTRLAGAMLDGTIPDGAAVTVDVEDDDVVLSHTVREEVGPVRASDGGETPDAKLPELELLDDVDDVEDGDVQGRRVYG